MVKALQSVPVFKNDVAFQNEDKTITANIDEETFKERVNTFKKLIKAGDMFQVVPSRIYQYKHGFQDQLDSLSYQLYRKLKRRNPSPYLYYINLEDDIIVGSSPESFVKVTNNKVTTNPIAGTISRGRDEHEDCQNAKQLMNDEKELSEHRMLVDLGRNDVHRVSKVGSVSLKKLMDIERFEHVMHIVSEVEGELKDDISPIEVITSLLPTGTVSGAPKLRAIQRIYETHPYKRGVYSGGVGYINCNQNLDLALAIRTMLIDDTFVRVEAGCGVVYDSKVENELNETKLKAKSLLEVTP